MVLLTIGKAATQPYSPSRQYLSKLSKHDTRPDYFIFDDNKYKINVQHPEWLALIKKRAEDNPELLLNKNIPKSIQHPKTTPQETPPENKPDKKNIDDLVSQSQIANLEEQILKNENIRFKNEQEKIKLKKSCNDIMETRLADFLYFGYIEKMNIELLSLNKKIGSIIDNLVNDGDSDGVKKRYQREFESMIKNIIALQKSDLQKWENEK